MKWFRHDTGMIYDPKIRLLGGKLKVGGVGLYIGLITYIACHGEEFQIRILDKGEQFGKEDQDTDQKSGEVRKDSGETLLDLKGIPTVSSKDLARILVTTRKRILKTIEVCVDLGLFDPQKWRDSAVLWSSTLAADQEQYAKKRERKRNRVRTMSGQTPEKVAVQEHIHIQEQEQRQEQVEQQKDLVVLLKSAFNVEELSTSDSQGALVPRVSDEDIKEFRRLVADDIREWNQRSAEKFDWIPTELEVCRLLRGGDREHKLWLCHQSMNQLGGDSTYPHVVRRAVGMMLDASRRKRITNPFGWLWTCLHGNGEGTAPWVQLATAEEET